MKRDHANPDRLARFLRQQEELGMGPIFLERLSRENVLAAARSSAQPPEAPAGAAPSAAAASGHAHTETTAPAGSVADYEELRRTALACTQCRLHSGRTQVVFADGSPTGRLMVIGEAPGANEDRTGLPFVGQAGKLLDLMLASVDLARKRDVYICNVIKCRPPGNRNPQPDEIDQCAPYLRRQIELVCPEVILTVGSFAAQWLTGSKSSLGRLRGKVYRYQGVPVVVTYHPAALLRNPGWTRASWDDLQLLCSVLDGG